MQSPDLTPDLLLKLWAEQDALRPGSLWDETKIEQVLEEITRRAAEGVAPESIMAAFVLEYSLTIQRALQEMLLSGRVHATDTQKGGDDLSVNDFTFSLVEHGQGQDQDNG